LLDGFSPCHRVAAVGGHIVAHRDPRQRNPIDNTLVIRDSQRGLDKVARFTPPTGLLQNKRRQDEAIASADSVRRVTGDASRNFGAGGRGRNAVSQDIQPTKISQCLHTRVVTRNRYVLLPASFVKRFNRASQIDLCFRQSTGTKPVPAPPPPRIDETANVA
jgi:hypothetical protein